jgi:uncharacterized coiled-coil protein SlyX
VQQRRIALENANRVVRKKGGPAAFPGAHQPASAATYFPPRKTPKPARVVAGPINGSSIRGYPPEESGQSMASEVPPGDGVNYGTFSATRPMDASPVAGPSHDDAATPITRIRNLESRIVGLEQECVDQARTIDTLHIKLRNQQQVENTHQAVIRDMVHRVQSLEERYRFKDDDITELKSSNADLQAKVEVLEQTLQVRGSEFEQLSAQVQQLQSNMANYIPSSSMNDANSSPLASTTMPPQAESPEALRRPRGRPRNT